MVRRVRRRSIPVAALALVVALACASLLAHAPAAFAHAQLLDTSPQSGATVAKQPSEVIFEFGEPVGGTVGAVRVYDAQGNQVDNLDVSHPDGNQHWLGVGLRPGLPDGTYTATYRVISADTHIVYGGLVFNVGHAGAAPRYTVQGLIDRRKSGEVTTLAFGLARFLDYLSLALGIGGIAFLLCVWSRIAGEPDDVRRAFAGRLLRLLVAAVLIGLVANVLGILLQGATAAGVSLWSSLHGSILSDTLKSRFGEVWGARAVVWALFGLLLAWVGARARGRASRDREPIAVRVVAGLGLAYLAATPALSGHADVQSPTWLFLPSDVAHVLAASVWVGGIACLLLVLPAATRQLEGPGRTRLLLATLERFSPLALGCVAAIAATGVIQAIIDVRTLKALLDTTYGVLVIVKVLLLLSLIGLGWVNRQRVLPALVRLVEAGRAPQAVGTLARRTLRGEFGLLLAVFGVTAALISYAPPIDAERGPFSTTTTLGPAELEMTVDPARAGLNTIHVYLIDQKTGAQFAAGKEFMVMAKLPSKGIGPLHLQANAAGPGHYVLDSAELSPPGTWELQISDRVSEFQEYSKTVRVPIR
jgi:copper transport protein